MNKPLFITSLVLITTLAVSFVVYANAITGVESQYESILDSFDMEYLDKMNIKLEKTSSPAKITSDVAVESAKSEYESCAKDAKEISIEYVAMTCDYELFSEKALEKTLS